MTSLPSKMYSSRAASRGAKFGASTCPISTTRPRHVSQHAAKPEQSGSSMAPVEVQQLVDGKFAPCNGQTGGIPAGRKVVAGLNIKLQSEIDDVDSRSYMEDVLNLSVDLDSDDEDDDVLCRRTRRRRLDRASGMLKGDALVTYLREPSVELAIQMLDGVPFRPRGGQTMTVSKAKFEMKGDTYKPKKKPNAKARKAMLQRQERNLEWGGFDDKLPPEKVTVILRHMFSPDELLEDFTLSEDLESDVRAECVRLGAIEKVRVFKENPDGIISVKFKEEEAAKQCLEMMHGRWFGGRQVEAFMWDGLTNYQVKIKESVEEQEARLEAFARELEAKAAAEKATAQFAQADAPAAMETDVAEHNSV